MFHVTFWDEVNNTIGGPVEVAERESFTAVSLLAARARSLGILNTPEIVGSLAEGLGFSDEVLYNYQGDAAEVAAIGSCIQLLCGASPLVQGQLELQRLVAHLVLSEDAGAARGHAAGIVTVLPSPVARDHDDRQATGRITTARLFVDHGGGSHCISIEIKRVRFQTTIS